MVDGVLLPNAQPVRTARTRSAPAHELWRLRGATDDLRGLAIETSFGYALGLELDHELVLLHLQPSLDTLVTAADRLELALLAQGWQRVTDRPCASKEPA